MRIQFASLALPLPFPLPSLFSLPFLNAAHSLYLGGSSFPVPLNFFPPPLSLPFLPPAFSLSLPSISVQPSVRLPIAHHHRFNNFSSGGVRSLFSVWSVRPCYANNRVNPHLISYIAYSPSDSYLTLNTHPSWALISTHSKLLLP